MNLILTRKDSEAVLTTADIKGAHEWWFRHGTCYDDLAEYVDKHGTYFSIRVATIPNTPEYSSNITSFALYDGSEFDEIRFYGPDPNQDEHWALFLKDGKVVARANKWEVIGGIDKDCKWVIDYLWDIIVYK